jgi:osmotically-inducible protein OsmY
MKVVDKADDQIKDALQKTLTADKTLDGISVKSVDKGVVLLAGKATTAAAVKAARAAHASPGVRAVSSEIALDK